MDLLVIFLCFIALVIFIIVMVFLLLNVKKSINHGSAAPGYMSPWEYHRRVTREMYSIWLGRVFDIASKIMFEKRIAIGRDHYISVLIWLFTILGISGYLLNYNTMETKDFWFVVVGNIILITFFYSQMKVAGFLSPPTDNNHDSGADI